MDLINHAVAMPDVQYIQLIPVLVYFLLLIHVLFMGSVVGTGALSVFYRPWKPDVGKEFAGLTAGAPWMWVAFGLLPPVALAFLLKMLYIDSPVPVHFYLLRLTVVLLVGFVLMVVFRKNLDIRAGGAGLLVLLFYAFYFSNIMGLMVYPEKWPFLTTILPHPLHSITGVLHFLGFVVIVLMMTGAGSLFFFFRWRETRIDISAPHYRFLKYNGLGLLLAGALLLPAILIWDLYTLPRYSFSFGIFALAGLLMLSAFLLALLASHFLLNAGILRQRLISISLVLVLSTVGLMIGKDRMIQVNSVQDRSGALRDKADESRQKWLALRQELYPSAKEPDAKEGERIFQQRCTACHLFDRKKLGPSMNDALAKYGGDSEKLAAFLRKPVKVDPNYPAMPNPGLSEFQVKSVVSYLLSTQEGVQ